MGMKINVANPATGQQKTFDITDEHALNSFMDKRMGAEVAADPLGADWAGYAFRITGGNDKQGIPMMQGVLQNKRVRLLFKDGMPCYRARRGGLRKRKSVRGCIVGHDLAILNFVIETWGGADIAGLTDGTGEKRLGPKRATGIRSVFDLTKGEDDVRKFVVRRDTGKTGKDDKSRTKAVKIQRLVTASRLQRKRRVRKAIVKKVQKNRADKEVYAKQVHDYVVAVKEKKHQSNAALLKRKQQKAAKA